MLWKIYVKEMKDAFRDRKTLMLSVLLPIILFAGMTLFFDKVIFGEGDMEPFTVAVQSSLEPEVNAWLGEIPNIEIKQVNDAMDAAAEGEALVGLHFEQGFFTSINGGKTSNITIYADQSSMKATQAVDYLTNQFSQYGEGILAQRLTENGIDPETIKPLDIVVEKLSQKDEASVGLLSMFLPMIIVMSVMTGGFPAAIDLFAGEKERKTMESLLLTPVSRIQLIIPKWLTVATLGMLSGLFAMLSFSITVKLFTENLKDTLNFGDQTIWIIIAAIFSLFLFALLFASAAVIISIVAKTFKESQNYMSPLMMGALIRISC